MLQNALSRSSARTRTLAHASFFWLSPAGRTALDQVLDAVVGFKSKRDIEQLADTRGLSRRLRNEGLPKVRELSGWLRVLACVNAWETERLSLSAQALASGADPANWSRTIRARTGRPWTEVRALGSGWCLAQLWRQCWHPVRVSAEETRRSAREVSAA